MIYTSMYLCMYLSIFLSLYICIYVYIYIYIYTSHNIHTYPKGALLCARRRHLGAGGRGAAADGHPGATYIYIYIYIYTHT